MKYFLLVVQFLLVCKVDAQTKGSVGFEMGPNIATIRGQNLKEEKLNPMAGVFAGVTFSCHFSDQLAVKTGVFYDVKGAKRDISLTDKNGYVLTETEFRDVFKYLTIPLMMNYSTNNKVNLFVNAGPYFSFLIQNTLEADNVPDYGNVKVELTDEYKLSDFGVSFGIGISKDFGSGWNVRFEIRDNLGLTNIIKEGADNYSVNHNTFNFLPGISYMF